MRAALERFAGAEPAALLAGILADDDAVGSYEELLARCPPSAIGLSPGAHAALLGPLFGEFE